MSQNINNVACCASMKDTNYFLVSVNGKLRRIAACDTPFEDEINALAKRVSNLATLKEGSTTGDAELMDIRTAYNGTIYDSAGDAVREQIALLDSRIINYTRTTVQNQGTVTLEDCNEEPLQGVRIFGKTTQAKTPSDGNPQALVSIGEGASINIEVFNPDSDGDPQTVSFSKTNGLPGLKYSASSSYKHEGNYTDATGTTWWADERNYERGVDIQRVGVLVFDGSEDERWYRDTDKQRFWIATNPDYRLGPTAMCSHYKSANLISYTNTFGYHFAGGYVYFRPSDYASLSLDDWKARLAADPVTFMFPLKEPIATPIPEEELKAYRQLIASSPKTTVQNDAEAWMEVIYNKDFETYIEQFLETGGATEEQIAEAVKKYIEENPNQSGSDASVTTENIVAALGYTPADAKKVDELSDQIKNLPSGSGLTQAQINALDGMFKVALYDDSKDYAGAYTAFKSAFGIENGGGGEEPDEPDIPTVNTYTISNDLVNVTSDNSIENITEGSSYTATLVASDGYVLDAVTVLMGGTDITATAYADGVITIASVTGSVEIVASAVVEDTTAELPTDGLLDYFDFRTCEYNNAGTGGCTTISATQGDGQLFSWAKDGVEVQDERGIHFSNTRKQEYSQAGNTTATDVGTAMTIIVLTYGQVSAFGFGTTNTGSKWSFYPKYNKADGGTAQVPARKGEDYNSDSVEDYNFCVYRVDGNTLTEIMDTSVEIYNGVDIDGFASWETKPYVQVQFQTTDGYYCTAAAIYNRALTDVEIEEVRAFMRTLEVA